MGFCFRVQSSEYSPVYLQGRIDNFINEMDSLLSELDDESFENFKSGLIAKLLEKDPSLSYETNRYWGQITDQRYMFDLSVKEAGEVKCLEKSEITNWYNTYLKPSSPKCRRLAVRVWGCNTNINESKTKPASVQKPAILPLRSYFIVEALLKRSVDDAVPLIPSDRKCEDKDVFGFVLRGPRDVFGTGLELVYIC